MGGPGVLYQVSSTHWVGWTGVGGAPAVMGGGMSLIIKNERMKRERAGGKGEKGSKTD